MCWLRDDRKCKYIFTFPKKVNPSNPGAYFNIKMLDKTFIIIWLSTVDRRWSSNIHNGNSNTVKTKTAPIYWILLVMKSYHYRTTRSIPWKCKYIFTFPKKVNPSNPGAYFNIKMLDKTFIIIWLSTVDRRWSSNIHNGNSNTVKTKTAPIYWILLVMKPYHYRTTRSIPWLLMPWWLVSPGHQQQ